MLEHIVNTLTSEKVVRMLGLAQAVEEQWQVVVIVQLLDLHLPRYLVALGVVLESDRKVAAQVELSKRCRLARSFVEYADMRWRHYL